MPDVAPLPRLPVETVFDRIVEKVGGCRVDTLFASDGNAPLNADYYFRDAGVVAELKEIVADLHEDTALRERLGNILHRYVGQKGVPLLAGTQRLRIDLLPDDCRHEMMLPLRRKLEGPVKKAARQIKQTKLELNEPNARGLLVLVNEGSTFLRPDIAFYFLHQMLKGQHSSIDQVVYCSINMLVTTPSVQEGARFWATSRVEGRQEIPLSFMHQLYKSFRCVIDKQTGVAGVPIIVDSGEVNRSAFVKLNSSENLNYFVRAKQFYRNPTSGFSYYCEDIVEGSAIMYLVESWQQGKFVQALFEQKLIHATRHQYQVITDKKEITRLRRMLRELRRGG